MPMMRVAMFGSLPPLRGISAYCLELARSLAEKSDLEFISFSSMYPRRLYPGGDPNDPSLPPLNGEKFSVRRSLAWHNPLGWASEALRVRPDVIHVQHWSLPLAPIWATILLSARMRNLPTVLTLHNVAPHEKSQAYIRATRSLAHLAGRCIVHSEINKRQAIHLLGLPPRKISVVRHGTLSPCVAHPPDRLGARARLDLPMNAPVALFFGSIRPYKGVDFLLEAFARMLPRLPEARLVIAGKPWNDWSCTLHRIVGLGISDRVQTFADYIPSNQMQDFLDAADLCVFPYSHFQAQSGAALTAIAFHKPLIVTDVGALPELVPDRRFVIQYGCIESLSEALFSALADPGQLKRMAEQSSLVARQHSWEDIASNTLDVYAESLHRRSA